MLRTSNPALTALDRPQTWADFAPARPATMTVAGTVNATLILLGACAASALGSWMLISSAPGRMMPFLFGGMLGGLVLALIIVGRPASARFLAPIYAVAEGAFLAGVSYFAAMKLASGQAAAGGAAAIGPATGVIFQAIMLTFGIFFIMLLAYRIGLVRVGGKMAVVIVSALGGVIFLYIALMLLNLVGYDMPLLHELFGMGKAGWVGIGFSAFMIVLGSLMLVMDFQHVEAGVAGGAPKHMEWYAGFGLLVTLVWLYVEVLRLLMKIQSRD